MGVVDAPSRRKTKRLGRYELVRHLAQGGMADVLIARTVGIEGFERHVVLKRIRADAVHDKSYVSMFLDEARLAASLHHHNIVQVTDIGQEDGEYFFTMEYVHGEDARTLLTRVCACDEVIPLEHVIGIVCGAAAGLHHAHEQRGPDREPLGLVHRDVSPANILIGYDGGVKVTDFGIAKTTRCSTETQSGTLKGKVAYMSPEQCVSESLDRRSDVFSLGIVLYELCTARRLFKGENDFLTMTSIVLGYVPPPSTLRPDLPPALEAVVMKALSIRPEDRYQTAQELRIALEQVATTLGLTLLDGALADYMKQTFGDRPEPWLVDDDEPEIEITTPEATSQLEVDQPITTARASSGIPIALPRYRAKLGIAAAVACLIVAVAVWSSRSGPTPAIAAPLIDTSITQPAPMVERPVTVVNEAPVVAPPKPLVIEKPVVRKPIVKPTPKKKKWNRNALFLE